MGKRNREQYWNCLTCGTKVTKNSGHFAHKETKLNVRELKAQLRTELMRGKICHNCFLDYQSISPATDLPDPLKLLEELEWIDHDGEDQRCLMCGGVKPDHKEDCRLKEIFDAWNTEEGDASTE